MIVWAVAMGLGCGAAVEGRAAPPATHDGSLVSHQATHMSALQPAAPRAALTSAGGAQTVHEGTGQLDLRPPAMLTAAEVRSNTPGPALRAPGDGSYQSRVAALAGLNVPMHESSRIQEFGERVRREGVPIARLFESRSALLSLGLSPRGKPGLWLIQKTP